MAPNRGHVVALLLAAHVEAKLVSSWTDGPYVALLRHNDEVERVALRSIREPAEVSIAELPREIGTAACVTALGYVDLSDGHGTSRRRARITAAVTCCSATSLLRFTDGDVVQSDEADGPLVDVLRSWAGLDCCCLTPSVRKWDQAGAQ